MEKTTKQNINSGAKNITFIAVMAASIVSGKLALSFIPYNIEIVTLLCALYGYVFSRRGVAATIIFVFCDAAMSGFGAWIITYFIYWPLVSGVFWLLGKIRVKNRAIITLVAGVLTLMFGLIFAAVDIAIYMGVSNYWFNFWGWYVAGAKFYAIQIACNLVVFPLAFRPLCEILIQQQRRRHLS